MAPLRVLVADDHPLILVSLEGVVRARPELQLAARAAAGDQALAAARAERPDLARADVQARREPAIALSPREHDVLRGLARGLTGPQIAAELHVSPSTIKTHLGRLYERLGVSDRAAAVAEGMRRGLIE